MTVARHWRHEFDPGYTGMSEACNRLVLRDDYGDDCGLPREHPIHVHEHAWVFDGYFWHRCSTCGEVS